MEKSKSETKRSVSRKSEKVKPEVPKPEPKKKKAKKPALFVGYTEAQQKEFKNLVNEYMKKSAE